MIVKELEIHYDEGTISAATYGRGVWESPLNTLSGVSTFNENIINFNIYPNPAEDEIKIITDEKNITVMIYNIKLQKIITSTSKIINISKLQSGYDVVCVESNGKINRENLIIK